MGAGNRKERRAEVAAILGPYLTTVDVTKLAHERRFDYWEDLIQASAMTRDRAVITKCLQLFASGEFDKGILQATGHYNPSIESSMVSLEYSIHSMSCFPFGIMDHCFFLSEIHKPKTCTLWTQKQNVCSRYLRASMPSKPLRRVYRNIDKEHTSRSDMKYSHAQ